jgi:hypothetical protein
LLFDFYLLRHDYDALNQKVKTHPVSNRPYSEDVVSRICYAMDLASIWYYKVIKCTQRSAATTCMLRDFGAPAQMIIGVQKVPFKSHAWTEVNGQVVSDKPYMREMWAVVDQF